MEPVQQRIQRSARRQRAVVLQLRKTEAVLARSQTQLCQTETLLARYRTQLAQTEIALTQAQAQAEQQSQALSQTQADLSESRQQIAQQTNQLQQAQYERARIQMQQVLRTNHHADYQFFVWEAWYAYYTGNLAQMAEYLKQALARSPFSRSETVLDWLASFAQFAAAEAVAFDPHPLSTSAEWQQLVNQQLTVSSSVLTGLLARSEWSR